MDLACTAVGVDASTLKRWLALGEAAYRESEEEDPHCRFFEAFVKALEYADSRRDNEPQPSEPKPEPPPKPRSEPRRTRSARSSEAPPLVWLVVEEAPIEIVIGSRPPWVYETPSAPDPVPATETPRPSQLEDASFEDAPAMPAEPEESDPRRDAPIGEDLAVIAIGLATLVVLIAAVLLTLAAIPVAMAGFVVIGTVRLTIGSLYRWRAGLIALRSGGTGVLAIPGRATRFTSRERRRPAMVVSGDRTDGSVALAGRLRPQQE